ncbi:MAG TPA: FHA domain-containing protein [Fimbriimonadaceae bacterium]|nr:FHA domain-containing protein [Fimbriimonadaceae bacterium]
MRRLLAPLLLLASAAPAFAGINLTVPGQGPYKVWTDSKLPEGAPKDAKLIEKNPSPVELPASGYLAVLDTQSGNLAVKPVSGLKGDVALTDADFDRVGEFKLQVTHAGKPVQSASITVKSGNAAQNAILDSSMAGYLSFYSVKQGSLDIKILYASNGKQAKPMELVYDLSRARSEPVPVVQVVISDEVATVGSDQAAAKTAPGQENDVPGATPAPKQPVTTGSIAAKTLGYLFGLVFVGGVGYLFYWLWKVHPNAVSEKLTALGVQIPKDPNEAMDPGPIQPAAPPKPEPPQKIILEDSDPTPLAPTMAAAPPVAAVVAGAPARLVSDSGGAMSVPEGTTLIGREATLGVALPDPSTLSRRHAELVRQGDSLLVRDLGSTNGTFVNGRKIDADTPLNIGDAVQFGAVRFRVEA